MRRVRPLAGTVLAAALLTGGVPARADDVTTVGYSGDFTAFIVAVWRPTVAVPSVADAYDGVTKAECKWEGAGSSQTGVHGVFYAKVVTSSAQERESRPDQGLAVATGVVCRLKNAADDVLLFERESVLPGSASAGAWVVDVTGVHRPKICVSAYVIFNDGTRKTKPEACRAA